VIRKEDLPGAIQRMLDHDGPYLLDVMVPHQEHVLPMVPGGGAFKVEPDTARVPWFFAHCAPGAGDGAPTLLAASSSWADTASPDWS